MIGNLSLDMFVLRKKKSTYFTALLILACVLLTSMIAKFATFPPESRPDTSFTGLFIGGSGLALLFLSIFYVMFLGSDLKNGFIKNTAGTVHNRVSYIISKQLTLAVYSLVGIAVLSLGSFLCAVIFFDGTKGFEAMPFIRHIAILYLLLLGLSSFITFIVFAVRNTTAPMVVTLLLTSGTVMNLIYEPIKMLLDKAGVKFDFKYISVTSNIIDLRHDLPAKDMLIACAVGVGYIIVFNVLTKIVMDKKDIA